MKVFSLLPAQTIVVLVCDFVLLSIVYIGSGFLLSPDAVPLDLTGSAGWLRLLLAVGSVLAGLYFNELFLELRISSRVALALRLSHVFGLSLITQTLLAYLNPSLALPRRVVLLGTIIAFPLLFLWRTIYSGFLWNLFGQQTVLLVGSGPLAQDLTQHIAERPDRGFRLMGYVGVPVGEDVLPSAYLGPAEELASIVFDSKPDRIVVAWSEQHDDEMPIEELLKVRRRGMPILEGSRFYEMLCSRICSYEFRPAEYIFDDTLVHRPGSLALQSVYVNVLALTGIILLAPVLLLIAAAVRITSRGPILEQVQCTGYRRIPFNLLRFRVAKTVPGTGRLLITGVGRFLRKTHLDLLPALFNLLRGELALVGPRPNRQEVSEELARRIPFYEQRYALKPGLTGWSQINMEVKNEAVDALTALEYDLYYLKNLSLSLDAYILLHRVRKILSFGV